MVPMTRVMSRVGSPSDTPMRLTASAPATEYTSQAISQPQYRFVRLKFRSTKAYEAFSSRVISAISGPAPVDSWVSRPVPLVGTGRPQRRVRRQALARANELTTDPAPHRALGHRLVGATAVDLAAQLRHASLVVPHQVLGG